MDVGKYRVYLTCVKSKSGRGSLWAPIGLPKPSSYLSCCREFRQKLQLVHPRSYWQSNFASGVWISSVFLILSSKKLFALFTQAPAPFGEYALVSLPWSRYGREFPNAMARNFCPKHQLQLWLQVFSFILLRGLFGAVPGTISGCVGLDRGRSWEYFPNWLI